MTRSSSPCFLLAFLSVLLMTLLYLYVNVSVKRETNMGKAHAPFGIERFTLDKESTKGKPRMIFSCTTGKALFEMPVTQVGPLEKVHLNASLSEVSKTQTDHNGDNDDRFNAMVNVFKEKDEIGQQVSGPGSNLKTTLEHMITLQSIIQELKVKLNKKRISILDIPCGDMVWMQYFLKTRDDVDYTGMDIVPELITEHKKSFANEPWTFIQQDVVLQPLNTSYDLIHNRQMLFHLKSQDIFTALKHFSESGSKYLITSSHSIVDTNTELNYNRRKANNFPFRFLNLELPPYSLAPPLCYWRDEAPIFGLLYALPLQRVKEYGQDCYNIKHRRVQMGGTEYVIHTC